jgi:hypothetical protein
VASRHTIRVAADPAHVYEVARNADLGRPGPVRLLMGLRAIPAWLAGARPGQRSAPRDLPARGSLGAVAFTLIAESPHEEFVLGIMGRFWTPTGGLVAADVTTFRHPPPPGLAQGFWNFRVAASANGTELSTETRVRCGDEPTRRHFRRYWQIIRFGSGIIRGSMLRHIQSVAERRAA